MSKAKTAGSAATVPRGGWRVFIRDLVLTARIGVHPHEHLADQRIRINLELTVADQGPVEDDLEKVVNYSDLMSGIRAVVGTGHVNLVETLAERIAAMCLGDDRVETARVRIEKLDVFPETDGVGVEIERHRKKA